MELAFAHHLEEQWDALLDNDEIISAYAFLQQHSDALKEAWGTGRYHNECGVLAAVLDEIPTAKQHFAFSLPESEGHYCERLAEHHRMVSSRATDTQMPAGDDPQPTQRRRIAIVSLLFNWPSTGGGTVHTAELAQFLEEFGYDVRHFCIQYAPWGIGQVENSPSPVDILAFQPHEWSAPQIQQRVREAVQEFDPSCVIVTSSWNFKPLLAQAVAEYPFILRYAALESLCPLNNVRLLIDNQGQPQRCSANQLSSPQQCLRCVQDNQHLSGALHQAERALSGYGSTQYDQLLRWSLQQAKAVFVVNPLIAALFSGHARRVEVVPSGFDPERFPISRLRQHGLQKMHRILFAGLQEEYMKGFHVLQAAARQLWIERQDFRIVITGEPRGELEPWMEHVGWHSQNDLPELIASCDLLVFPTVAEEGLGRSAVEAMACGVPVIASRLGGLQFTISDQAQGLLFEAGNGQQLHDQIQELLDQPERRQQMGMLGRRKFVQEFPWDHILRTHYLPLLGTPMLSSLEVSRA